MKILFIIPSYKPAYIYGGTTLVVSLLAEQLVKEGNEVAVFTTTANGKDELPGIKAGETLDVNGVQVTYFKRITKDHTHLSVAMLKCLHKTARGYDIIHLHSWWNLFNISAASILVYLQKPYIISAHGMLSTYTFKNQHSKLKDFLHHTIGKRLLAKSAMHACTHQEYLEGRKIIRNWEGFTIANLITLPGTNYSLKAKENKVFTLAFLSRIEQKKGLDNLIDSLPALDFDYKIKIAGGGEETYIQSLKNKIKQLNLADKVEWTGWLDKEKFDFLASADVFILPSYNENFAVVVLEAIAAGTPVLISNKVGLSDFVKQYNLGWVYDGSKEDLLEKLNQAYKDTLVKAHVQQNGFDLVRENFESKKLTQSYIAEYRKCLN